MRYIVRCRIVSIMVMFNAIVIIGYDERRSGLPDAPIEQRNL